MTNAFIYDAARTPRGKGRPDGSLHEVTALALSARLLNAVKERNGLEGNAVEDVIWGCVNQTLEQGWNIARMASLLTRIPHTSAGQTVSRLCGSSMSALHTAVQAIQTNNGDVFVIGGVEHMGHVSMMHGVDPNPQLSLHAAKASGMMGLTAEMLGKMHGISREAQDQFGERSHRLAHKATVEGKFKDEIIPIKYVDDDGNERVVSEDDGIRPGVSKESLSKLKPAFAKDGCTHAGNASQVSDGAAAVLLARRSVAQKLGLPVVAKFAGAVVVGVPPNIMGVGPAFAIPKLLEKAQISKDDIDIYEINEAFASQALFSVEHVGLPLSKVNPVGGAIAMGHPLGATGSRQIATALSEAKRTGAKLIVTSMCIGTGMGMASLIVSEQ